MNEEETIREGKDLSLSLQITKICCFLRCHILQVFVIVLCLHFYNSVLKTCLTLFFIKLIQENVVKLLLFGFLATFFSAVPTTNRMLCSYELLY